MESIQLAQMLADLSDLDAAQEAAAALALVNANKGLQATAAIPDHVRSTLKPPADGRHHHRVNSSSASAGRTASPASRFDHFGRRILTPPMTRSSSSHGSLPGTPRRESEVREATRTPHPGPHRASSDSFGNHGPDWKRWLMRRCFWLPSVQNEDEVDRASTLMSLYEIRAKIKQQDNSSLMRAREKVQALAARQQAQAAEKKEAHNRYSFPRHP
ncbi:hypothetical protein RB597_004606 [Gaeumannomyces tritici]